MTDLKFVEELPHNQRGGGARGPRKSSPLLTALRANPGQWAEVHRLPVERRSSLGSMGSNYKKRYPDLEATTRRVGDEVVLYMRAVSR